MCLVRVRARARARVGDGVRVRVRVLEPVCARVSVVDLRSVARHLPVVPSDKVGLAVVCNRLLVP